MDGVWRSVVGSQHLALYTAGNDPRDQTSGPRPSAPPRIEEVLWNTADQLRGHMDAAEYKHVVLGLVFLKYISDAFTTLYDKLKAEEGEETAEDRDEYLAEGVFWVPREARWDTLKDHAREATIGSLVDKAMAALEKENAKQLGGMLPPGTPAPASRTA